MQLKLYKEAGNLVVKIIDGKKTLDFDYVSLVKAILNAEEISFDVSEEVDSKQSTHLESVINHLKEIADNPEKEIDYTSFTLEKLE